jgi:hypothetical protein
MARGKKQQQAGATKAVSASATGSTADRRKGGRKQQQRSSPGGSGLPAHDPLERQLALLGLRVKSITADGNCCFRALSDQLAVSARAWCAGGCAASRAAQRVRASRAHAVCAPANAARVTRASTATCARACVRSWRTARTTLRRLWRMAAAWPTTWAACGARACGPGTWSCRRVCVCAAVQGGVWRTVFVCVRVRACEHCDCGLAHPLRLPQPACHAATTPHARPPACCWVPTLLCIKQGNRAGASPTTRQVRAMRVSGCSCLARRVGRCARWLVALLAPAAHPLASLPRGAPSLQARACCT